MALMDELFKKKDLNDSTNVIKTICYGRVKEWHSREEAEQFFMECLVELGFKHISGKHVEARPFMRPAYETFTPEMLEDIKKIIERGGR